MFRSVKAHAGRDMLAYRFILSTVLPVLLEGVNKELDAAAHLPDLRSSSTFKTTEVNQVAVIHSIFINELPLSVQLVGSLCGSLGEAGRAESSEDEHTADLADGDDEQRPEYEAGTGEGEDENLGAPRTLKSNELVRVVILSVILRARSQRTNRLQALVGCLLRFHHAPKAVQTLINRLFLSTSRVTSRRHLKALNEKATEQAQDLMRDSSRVKVLLFDNVDIYLRVRAQRIGAASQLINLTTRTLLRLPESFHSDSITKEKLSPLSGKRKLALEEVYGDGSFFAESARLLIAQELLESYQQSDAGTRGRQQTVQLIIRVVRRLQDVHRKDEIEAKRWDFAPLPLLEENEGSIEGTMAVIENSALTLGILKDTSADDEIPGLGTESETGNTDSSSLDLPLLEQTDILGADGVLLATGDLKSHRNIEAGQNARKRHERDADRMDYVRSIPAPWHLLLNWVWTIFKVHFSQSKVGFSASLERQRDALRRGKTALREEQPSFTEAWALIRHVFSAWTRIVLSAELRKKRKDLATWTPTSEAAVMEVVDDVWNAAFHEGSIRRALLVGDEVGANARLLLRDVAFGLEWSQAVRVGDIGRMAEARKFLVVGFAGAGRHQYAEACLDDIWAHKILPKETWRTLEAARLVNRFGSRWGFIGADLYQEHLNKEVQRADTAHGAEFAIASLQDTYSATAETARAMRTAHQDLLGSTTSYRKKKAMFRRDIDRLSSLAEQDGLFVLTPGRCVKDQDVSVSALPPFDEEASTASELMANLVGLNKGQDVLESGWLYMLRQGLQRWEGRRGGMERYEAFLCGQNDESQKNIREGHVDSQLSADDDAEMSQDTQLDTATVLASTGEGGGYQWA
ncbi:hypothetical protein A4X13_0g2293 [Tilletia indica]|uniref:DUF6589 domain-containing protein n=1 Tax=Tilletia indica TaxID=43049 RepID=A0A8T8T837_9BASI|nr:hypothetical protein A4X13_0g2293 [Tilletia indica]